jgi:hypothetical protein
MVEASSFGNVLDGMFLVATREQKEASKGDRQLLSFIDENKEEQFTHPPGVKDPEKLQTILKREYELLGFFQGASIR